jgi:Domain of unknown function (DUF4328)/Protein of unknown function (DUF2510)
MSTPGGAVADWYPDPLGRGEYRYWDGERWTQWMANGGASTFDDVDLPDGLPEPSQLAPSTAPAGAAPRPFAAARFRPVAGLATALTWLLGASVASTIALVAAFGNRIAKLDAFERDPGFDTLRAVDDADDIVSSAAGVLLLVSVAVFVVLVVFLFRASSNTALWNGSRPTWGPGWTIGSWFIPLGNLVLVPMVVAEIWRRTPEPESERDGASTSSTSIAPIVVWWVILVAGAAATRDFDPDTVDQFRTHDWIHLGGGVLLAVAGALLIWIVRTLARRHTTLAARPLAPG